MKTAVTSTSLRHQNGPVSACAASSSPWRVMTESASITASCDGLGCGGSHSGGGTQLGPASPPGAPAPAGRGGAGVVPEADPELKRRERRRWRLNPRTGRASPHTSRAWAGGPSAGGVLVRSARTASSSTAASCGGGCGCTALAASAKEMRGRHGKPMRPRTVVYTMSSSARLSVTRRTRPPKQPSVMIT